MPTATAKKSERARFTAPGENFRVVVEPQKERFSEGGVKQPVPGTGKTIAFLPDGTGNSFFETADPEEISYLRERSALYATFTEVPVPKPPSAPVLSQIVGLAARGDSKTLVDLAREEEETHQREDVLNAIADALEQIA